MNKIVDLLTYVTNNNNYYKRLIEENRINDYVDLSKYPILTREQLQVNRYKMFSDGYQSLYFYQKLRRQSSSGSVGVPVSVYWDDKDYFASVRALWNLRFRYYGVRPTDRQVLFGLNTPNYSANNPNIYYKMESNNILSFNISIIHQENYYENMLDIIDDFKPIWLHVRPFVLQRLVLAYKKYNRTPPNSIKYIESIAEILTPELKKSAISLFNVPVANMYGSEEMNGIAYECPYNKMHIIEENVIVECLSESKITNHGEGEAIVTSLTNKAMPLIRYNQGDRIVLEESSPKICKCGSKAPTILEIHGRSLDSINIDETIELNPTVFLEIMSEVNNLFNSIVTSFNYVYSRGNKTVQCSVELEHERNGWYENVKGSIVTSFYKRIPASLGINLVIMPMINSQSFSKKHRFFEIVD